MNGETPLWQPSPERIAGTNLTRFIDEVRRRHGLQIDDYAGLYDWSIREPEAFWCAVWSFCGVIAETAGERTLVHKHRMPGARWFPDARLNFAENLLRRRDEGTALVFWGEEQVRSRLSYRALYNEVSQLAQALRSAGVVTGDRVAGYLPNMPAAVVAMLAVASIGAIWSSCSPDFGVQGVLDRFGQIEPVVLFTADRYVYGGKTIDLLPRVRELLARMPSVRHTICAPYREPAAGAREEGIVSMAEFIRPFEARDIEFAQLPFDHPLYILYSSGTTGVPKCIVHGAGGTLLQHLKEHQLHADIKGGERLFYFTTCGWMMWNWLVSGLASAATLLLYDGSPFAGNGRILFDYADAEKISVFGTSAKYIDAAAKLGLEPARTHDLGAMKAILSTGSPLVPESFDYVYAHVKHDVQLASVSGGTDIISCFVLGNPMGPVWRGEIQCRGLGLAVDVFDEYGRPVRGEKGELVCTAPFPSMPLGFWNDADGSKYRAAYFERFAGVWCHGDYVELTEHDGVVIYGRSDAVLNPGGVRIGTAEIYRQVEKLDEVMESLAIAQQWDKDVRVVLFVRLREGRTLDTALEEHIRRQIRENASPRHVPARIVQVTDIPRTKNGKIVELAVRNVVHGLPVRNIEALANPEALAEFENRTELQS
jgi:acetoacetyl-CoA synthetase